MKRCLLALLLCAGAVARADGPDLATPAPDLRISQDLASLPDLAMQQDLLLPGDLAISADLAVPPDLAKGPRDLATPADLSRPGDLTILDLAARPADLAMAKDQAAPTLDLAAPASDGGAPADLGSGGDLRTSDLGHVQSSDLALGPDSAKGCSCAVGARGHSRGALFALLLLVMALRRRRA